MRKRFGLSLDEKFWWRRRQDDVEPLIGVPSAVAAVAPAPLPDADAEAPEPGLAQEQQRASTLAVGHVDDPTS